MTDETNRAARLPDWVFTAICYALYALLLESVIESFVLGSSMRWIALGVIGAYALVTYALWNRIGPRGRSLASATVLLSLAAGSAWQLGSAAAGGGYAVATLSGSRLAALLSAGALVVGFVALWPLPWLPQRQRMKARLAIALLFAWALAPFVHALVTGAEYDGLFLGRGFWDWPPYWLQGAYLGIAVLLPVSLLLSVVGVSLALARRRFTAISARMFEWLVLVLVALMAAPSLNGLGLPHLVASLSLPSAIRFRADDTSPSYAQDVTSEDLETISSQMARGLEALAEALQQIPRDSFDPGAIVARVGRDPSDLFQWIRDRTRWAPYRGSLRGPRGVLMDRSGNSLDRSLLLAELLRLAGHDARLAHAELDEAIGARLLSDLRTAPEVPLPEPARATDDDWQRLDQLARKHGLDPERVRQDARATEARSARLTDQLSSRVDAQVSQLVELIGSRGDAQVALARERDQAHRLASVRDHWWVEYETANGWVPMDALLPDSKPGTALAEAAEVVGATERGQPIRLDARNLHEVELRVVIERSENGNLTQVPVLSHTLRPADLFGQSITLSHHPMAWPKNLDLLSSDAPLDAIRAAALAQKEWIPVLRIGPSLLYENSFTDTGLTQPAIARAGTLAVIGKQAEGMGTAADVLNNLFGAEESPSPTPTSRHLTAEWIEYEIRVPGETPRTIRRQLFDLVGPARRATGTTVILSVEEPQRLERGMALLGTSQILVTGGRLSAPYVNHLAISTTLANRKLLPDLLRRAASPISDESIEAVNELTPFPGELYDFVLTRQRLNPLAQELGVHSANLFSFHSVLVPQEDGKLALRRGFDIVANDVSALAPIDDDSFLATLTQGVLDTNAEAALVAPGECRDGAAELFASAEDTSWVVLRDGDDATLEQLGLPADARTRIEDDLAKGYLVVSPDRIASLEPGSIAWWRIDPVTGQTLGIDQRGHGSATATEYIQLVGLELGLFATGFYGGYMGCRSLSPSSSERVCIACGILIGLALATFILNIPITAPLIFSGAAAGICGR